LSLLASVTIVASTPFVVFWWIGDRGYQGPDPDYMVQLSLSERTVREIGLVSLVFLVAAIGYLLATKRIDLHGPATQLVGSLMVVGAIFAALVRVATASFVGANIGGGPLIVLGMMACILIVVVATKRYLESSA